MRPDSRLFFASESYSQSSKARSIKNAAVLSHDKNRVPRQLFSGGAVFRSKNAIHSVILDALRPQLGDKQRHAMFL
jgi:hypothetical protein